MAVMRLEAEAKNSSEKERMREVRGAETRSVAVSELFQEDWCTLVSTRKSLRGEASRWRGGSFTNAYGTECGVNLVWRNGIVGDRLRILNCLGGECLNFHYLGR